MVLQPISIKISLWEHGVKGAASMSNRTLGESGRDDSVRYMVQCAMLQYSPLTSCCDYQGRRDNIGV